MYQQTHRHFYLHGGIIQVWTGISISKPPKNHEWDRRRTHHLYRQWHYPRWRFFFQTGSIVIIDGVLVWYETLHIIMLLLECVCIIFNKYHVNFWLDKCDFFKYRVKYVGHDLLDHEIFPAQSKFNLMTDWPTPNTGQTLHYLLGLI